MKLPNYVQIAINLLEQANFKVYVVGGAVRDYLLGLNPSDFDLSTNATPAQTKEVFKDFFTIDTGLKHGTISVMINHKLIEITTFRHEDDYADFRRPSQVHFIKDIDEDLKRRDFTINSICFNKNFYDINKGMEDLNNKIIRAIGNANKRFTEDPLRILRALRFSSTLAFEIEEETKKAVLDNFHLLENVSKERINVEFSKLLLGRKCLEVIEEYKMYIEKYILKTKINDLNTKSVIYLNKNLVTRFAALLLGNETYLKVLKDLRYSKKQIKEIGLIINNYHLDFSNDKIKLLKLLKTIDYETIAAILEIKKARLLADTEDVDEIDKVIQLFASLKTNYLRIKDLKINGNDLKKIGYQEGIEIRKVLEQLLDECINGLENNYEVLMARARQYYKNYK